MTNSTRCALLAKQACTTFSHVVQKITPPSANNFLKYFFILFAILTLGIGNAWGAGTWTLVKDASTLSADDKVIIVAKDNNFAMSTTQNTNNRGHVEVTKDGETLTYTTTVQELTLKDGKTSGTLAFYTGSGYLYAASSSKNYLKTETTLSANSSWTITIANTGVATIKATGSNTRNWLRYNSTNNPPIFSCYGSGQGDVCLYKYVEEQGGDEGGEEATYSVTVTQPAKGGTIEADKTEAKEDDIVKLTATPAEGYKFGAWTVTGTSGNVVVTDNQFTMPAEDVTVSASFVAKTQYSVAWKVNDEDADGGSTSATEGEKVAALPNTPDDCSGDVVFVGWSDQEVSDGNKPALLFTDLAGSPEITGNTTFYAVFAKRTITTGGTPESVTNTYTFSNYTAGTQYADNEKHVLDDILTLYTTDCHFTSELRIYSSSTYNGYVISNQLPGKIVSLGFNAGNKTDVIVVSGSTDGSAWTTVGEVSITSTSYNDYSLNFGGNNYTYFKLDVKGENQVRLKSLTLTYQLGNGTSVDYSDYSTSCTIEQDYTITIADDIEHGTVTAPATAKAGATIILTATADENYSFGTWSVTEEGGTPVTVLGNQFTMPEANVTVSATFDENPKWTITWKSVEGSTTTEVYQGKSLGAIDDANDCPGGKVFMGWTAANEVNPNGLDIAYAKATDIPTDNTTYNAVYAKETIGSGEEGSAEVALASGAYDSTNKNITWTTDGYATILQTKGTSTTDVGNYVDAPRWYVGHNVTITPQSGVNITKIVINQGSDSKYQEFANATINNATITIDGQIITITPNDGTVAVTITPGKQLRPTAITIHKGPSTSYSHYSFDCEVVNDPYLNVDPTTITFDVTNVGFNSTKTIDITAGYLTEDITLALSGANANEFSVSTAKITKDEEVSQEVTVTYAPTAEGNHTATLTITSGTLSETVTLSGSAEVATIYTLTNLADINPNDKVIIVGTSGGSTYAMSNAQGTTAAPTAVAVTVVDDKIATNETTILWNISKSGDNLTIYPNGEDTKWLYTTNDNNGVRVGTNENKTFTIADGYLKNTSTNRYVGIYNKENWRCYTSTTTNIEGQTFAFYVLPDTDPSISVNTTSKDFGAVINGKSASQEFEITARNIATPAFSTSVTGANATYFTATINANKVIVTYAPTAVGEHVAALTITETTTSKSVEVALTGECVETVNVATAMAAAKDEIVYLKPFDVVYAVTGKEYVYIKDESGFGLIYDTDLANQLLNGDRVEGFVGKSSPYRSLPELKAHNTENMTITNGTAVEPTEFTTVPATSHVNQYVVFKNVTFDEDVVFNSSTATNATFKLNTNDVTLRNSFKFDVAFEADKAYDIYGAIATYQATESDPIEVQVYYLNSAEAGHEVVTYTVTYDANGASGNVPTDLANYAAGQQVIVAGQGEMTYENHMFTGWKYNGTVYQAGDKFNMPAENVTFVAQWEEVKTYDQGAWVLVTDASELTVDDDVIIAAANDNYALGIDQKSNNRGTGTIVKGSNVAFLESNVQILSLENGKQSGTLALSTGNGYLYAASSSSNYLRTETNLSDNSSWTIAINEGLATIKAQGHTHNLLQYNSDNKIFSCYSSAQKPVAIYEYNPNERVITFDVNGGEAYAHTYFATTGGTLTLPTDVPTHAAEGQLFSSWNDKQDGSGNTYDAGTTYQFTEHTTLYAQWAVADAYHVTYSIAGASGTTPIDANHYYGGETVTLASQGDLVNPGHIFAGWNVVDANNTEILVTENTFIMPQSDVTATAKWVRQTNDKWVLVTSTEQLIVGDKYVIACNTKNAIAGKIVNGYMQKIDATFSEDKSVIVACSEDPQILTLGKEDNLWTFINDDGEYLSDDNKSLKWAEEKNNWTIVIEDEYTAIAIPDYAIYYNPSAPRFKTYDIEINNMSDIQLYRLIPNQVVSGDKTDEDVLQYSNVTVENGGNLSVGNSDTQYGDVYINNGGSVEVAIDAKLTINNLYISTTMGATTSGQLRTAPENLNVTGDVFIDITLGKNGDSNQWHAFTVPFPVDAMNGVYDLDDKQLTNEVNYAIMDYHGDLRANGQYGWKKYRGILVPGTFYLMTVDGARTTYRFKKVEDAAIVAPATKAITAYTCTGDATKDEDKGWNGVGNPTLMHGKVAYDALVLNPKTYTYEAITKNSAYFTVGTPFFIQAATDGEVAITAEGNSSLAPARRAAAAVENIKVMLGNSDYTDRLYVSASEDATNEYEIGKDLGKMAMTNTPRVVQISALAYDTRLCMIDAPMANNEALVALNLYAPANGEYTLSVEAQDNEKVYLLHDGTFVWDLSMSEYPITLNKGDNTGYSILVRRADAPTSVETIDGTNNQTEKLIHNGNLYILHNGKVFDAVGTMLK